MNALADQYAHKARLCEHLAAHHRECSSIPVARQYEESAKHWRRKARELRNVGCN